jgi:hypothetical protein
MTHAARIPANERSLNWFWDGIWLCRYKAEDDLDTDTFDFSDWCEEIGSTISAVAWDETSGPTLGVATAATGDGGANMAVTSTVTKTGEAKLKVTAASGAIKYLCVRWLPTDDSIASVDYR